VPRAPAAHVNIDATNVLNILNALQCLSTGTASLTRQHEFSGFETNASVRIEDITLWPKELTGRTIRTSTAANFRGRWTVASGEACVF